jgi:hypothetical protein
MLSHAKTEMDVVKELASDDDKAYRSLTLSLKTLPFARDYSASAKLGFQVDFDYGSWNNQCQNPSKVVGDKTQFEPSI